MEEGRERGKEAMWKGEGERRRGDISRAENEERVASPLISFIVESQITLEEQGGMRMS